MENNTKYQIKRRDQMKMVSVIFVGDELIGSEIVSRKEHERVMKQKSRSEAEKVKTENGTYSKPLKRKVAEEAIEADSKRPKYIDDVELALAALENDDVEKITQVRPSTLFDEDEYSANKICNFENSIKTPKSEKKNAFNCKNDRDTLNNSKKVIKDIKEIQKILENSDDDFSGSDSDESYNLSDESFSDGSSEHSKSNKSFFESYCDLESGKKSKTSNSTLKRLKTPKLSQEKLDELLKNVQITPVHKNSIKTLFNEILNLFQKWDFILKQNYNVLLYGAGSKREILGKFVERFVDVHPVIVVNGFFPGISVREILEKVCTILKIPYDQSDVIENIQKKMSNYDLKIYIAINNIDGIMLRSNKVQSVLSQLGKLEQIHMIASIDHINAPLIWNKSTGSEFNWIWYDSTTFLNYSEETIFEGNIMLQQSGKATLSSLRNVYNSLTKNSQGIFMIILKHQIESGTKKAGLSFRELYQECRREFLVSSDVGLRAQLKEFIDHLVLKQKRSAEGEEQFVIVIENSILKQFLDEQEAHQN